MKKIFIFAAAALALVACDNNEDAPVTSPVAATVTGTIGESPVSRAVDKSWAKGDQIGISSTVGNMAGPYINVKYTTQDGDGVFKGTELFFYKPMTLTAYYPFTGEQGTPVGVIEANTRAANQDPAVQPGIDFLWDSQTGFTASNTIVNFKFAHKMSKVTFTFQSSDPVIIDGLTVAEGVEVGTMVSYVLKGVALDGTFDVATGVCGPKTATTADELAIEVSNVEHNQELSPLILFPQTLDGGSAELHIYTNELNSTEALQHYTCKLTFSDGKILPGNHYKYTIRVTKIGLIVGKMTIEPWVESERFIISTIDGNVFEE